MNNLFLTGEKGIGKSSLIKKAMEKMNVSIGGYITDRKVQDHKTSFITRSLNDLREEHIIANINTKQGEKEIFKDSFQIGLRSILDMSLKTRDLTVLDELGFMENNLKLFTSKVEELLDSEQAVFGVLKEHDCKFLNRIRAREDVIILQITRENRDSILDDIVQILEGFGLESKRKNSFSWDQKRIDWYNAALDHPRSDYPASFIREIKKYTGPLKGKTVLDIGGGTGAFALPLMEEGAHVTVVDSSFNMLNSLSTRAREKELTSYKAIISPFQRLEPEKHDIAISAFSGRSTKSLEGIKKMRAGVKDYAFIISSFEKQRDNFNKEVLFDMLGRPYKEKKKTQKSLEDTLEALDSSGYSYEYKKIKYEFSQYFNSLDEALDFFRDKYKIETAEDIKITREFIRKFSSKLDDQYKFENTKESWLITIRGESKNLISNQEVISLVGGGGKTTTIKDMASSFKRDGKKVLWTTSTAILKASERDYDEIFIGDLPEDYRPEAGSITLYGEYQERGKLRSRDLAKIDEIIARKMFDLVLIEADGAKCKPIKAPGDHEPVISQWTTASIGVIGMDALGQNIDRIAHRPDLLKEILGVEDDHIIGHRDIIKLVLHERGLFKDSVGEKILLLNKVKDDQLDLAKKVQKELINKGIEVYIGPYRSI